MKKDITIIFNEAKKLSMTKEEKKLILESVFAVPAVYPVRKPNSWRLYNSRGLLTLAGYTPLVGRVRSRMFTSFGVILVLLGTTSAMAQVALPGDVLYAVKININEKIRLLAVRTDDAKASLDGMFATRRLQEARMLLASHSLTESKSKLIASQFEAHTTRLEEHLGELKKQGHARKAADIKNSFVASVHMESKVLDTIADSTFLQGASAYINQRDETSDTGTATTTLAATVSSFKQKNVKSLGSTQTMNQEEGLERVHRIVRTLIAGNVSATSTTVTKKTAKENTTISLTATSTLKATSSASSFGIQGGTIGDVILSSSTPKSLRSSVSDRSKGINDSSTKEGQVSTTPVPLPLPPISIPSVSVPNKVP